MNTAGRYTAFIAGTLLAAYGAVRLVQDVRAALHPPKQDMYELFIQYPQPHLEFAEGSNIPRSVFIRRHRDARVVLDATIYDHAGRPAVSRQTQSQELTDVLNGKVDINFIGRPQQPDK